MSIQFCDRLLHRSGGLLGLEVICLKLGLLLQLLFQELSLASGVVQLPEGRLEGGLLLPEFGFTAQVPLELVQRCLELLQLLVQPRLLCLVGCQGCPFSPGLVRPVELGLACLESFLQRLDSLVYPQIQENLLQICQQFRLQG